MSMEELNYKEDIRATRVGGLGSSDAKIIAACAELGSVPRSANKRLAVVKGLIEQGEIPYTDAVRFGDEMEMQIFEHLTAQGGGGYRSNPLIVSEKYSRPNVKCLTHPDILKVDEEKKTIYAYEVKTSKHNTSAVREEYKEQLYLHYLLAREQAENLGKDWDVKVFLVHYNTEGLDLSQPQDFDVDRLTVRRVNFSERLTFDLAKGMDIINEFLETYDEYYEDIVPVQYLPDNVKTQFTEVATFLREIKEREAKVAEFKERLYQFFTERNITGVKCDDFSFTVVAPSSSVQMDTKAFFDEYAKKHPKLAFKARKQYSKTTKRKGYVMIKVKDNNNN